jgi:hypothetical protein
MLCTPANRARSVLLHGLELEYSKQLRGEPASQERDGRTRVDRQEPAPASPQSAAALLSYVLEPPTPGGSSFCDKLSCAYFRGCLQQSRRPYPTPAIRDLTGRLRSRMNRGTPRRAPEIGPSSDWSWAVGIQRSSSARSSAIRLCR